jgi:hypothetical protein
VKIKFCFGLAVAILVMACTTAPSAHDEHSGAATTDRDAINCTSTDVEGGWRIHSSKYKLDKHLKYGSAIVINHLGTHEGTDVFEVVGSSIITVQEPLNWRGRCEGGIYTVTGRFNMPSGDKLCSHELKIVRTPEESKEKDDKKVPDYKPKYQITMTSDTEHSEDQPACKDHKTGLHAEGTTLNPMHAGAAHGGTD